MNSEKSLIRMYTAKILDSQIEYLNNQLAGIELDGSSEFIHHTRVMSRRIRNTVEVFPDFLGKKTAKKWFVALKNLTKSLTKIRDIDVQILFLENELVKIVNQNQIQGVNRLLLRKKQKKSFYDQKVLKNIETFNKTETMKEIRGFIEKNQFQSEVFLPTSSLSKIAIVTIENHLKNCFSFVPYITNPNNLKELHALRIAIKNLRYSVELFYDLYPSLKDYLTNLKLIQDELGEIHDCDIWLVDLEIFRAKELGRITKFYGQSGPFNFIKPGIDFLEEEITNSRKITYELFLTHWNEYFQDQFWSRLRDQFTDFPPFEKSQEMNPELPDSQTQD
jgi:CHAD domain-containing protein